MYIDYYLKFDSEAEAKAVLYRVEGEERVIPGRKAEEKTYYLYEYKVVDSKYDPPEESIECFRSEVLLEADSVLAHAKADWGAEDQVVEAWFKEVTTESWPEMPETVIKPLSFPNYPAIDIIGTIYKPTGKMLKSEEGDVPEMAPLDGYHVNVRLLNDAPELEPYRVFPKNSVRGWA